MGKNSPPPATTESSPEAPQQPPKPRVKMKRTLWDLEKDMAAILAGELEPDSVALRLKALDRRGLPLTAFAVIQATLWLHQLLAKIDGKDPEPEGEDKLEKLVGLIEDLIARTTQVSQAQAATNELLTEIHALLLGARGA